ncbi:TKL protein kinase [Saprolegnia diclina VS20]|uniref:TKL protein kinase n=1 Tax=Saprolegnia diclina (strain VS20) TaxID=1156394 RepID=T0SDU7_SAPDV|nr:TKL protein kinase [Saprolegnia diclina VS20]EQC41022.1 TKL protein kinase [Saprolegnia diclina VS20]|eukprot:XP_008605866.1 TKL protein kinase [Saprolegnia diclina VS20]
MGCNSSKPEKPITIDVDEPFRPIASHDNLQNALTRTGDGKHRASTGSSAVPSSAASARSQATTSLNGVYNALLPLQSRYWIDPDDCGSSRKIKSSYMQTHLGYYQGHPTVIKSFIGYDKRPANVVDHEREDLIKEICSLAKLSHPNIVAFLGFTYTTPDDLKCVTEFMDGGNLRKLLDNPKRELTWATEKLSIALDVAMALAYLHELKPKVLHRNIKADKVLLSSTLEAKLSGFGSAREWSYIHTMTQKIGTVEWSAPELLLHEDYNERVDIYSFGVLLTELDTRLLPYADYTETTSVLVTNIITGIMRPAVSPSCPRPIAKLIHACLQLDSNLRPSADAIVQILREQHRVMCEQAAVDLSNNQQHRPSTKKKHRVQRSQVSSASHLDHTGSNSGHSNPGLLVGSGGLLQPQVPDPDFMHLVPLRNDYWIHPQDVVVSRKLPSSYMCTMLGHFRGDPVVVKMLNTEMDAGAIDTDRRYLVREICIMAKLKHPNIVTFYGFAYTNAVDLKCMTEFMAGGTLRALLNKPKRELTWDNHKLTIALDVAKALAYLHGHSPCLLHRNIKASKVLLTPGLGGKLSGFGYARAWSSQDTLTSAVGTMEWAAPELLRNEDYSSPADIYAFGVLLTELDTRLIPYDDLRKSEPTKRYMTDETLMMNVVTGKVKPTVSPSCPRSILKLIHACLQLKPNARPSSDSIVAILEQERLMRMGL